MNDESPRPVTFQPDIYDKVIRLVPDRRPLRALDVGAGEGYFSRKLKDVGVEVEACDFRAECFKCRDISFIKADLNEKLPCESNRYDFTVAIEVIEHIENHFRFVSEMIRVTKPGGIIVITTPNVLSMTSRRHFFLYGFTDCAPIPLDPSHEDYFLQHINPISLPELLFQIERFGAKLTALETNRLRRSSIIPAVLLYPLLAVAIRRKLLRKKHRNARELHRRHIHWLLSPASLMGRITIAVARKG